MRLLKLGLSCQPPVSGRSTGHGSATSQSPVAVQNYATPPASFFLDLLIEEKIRIWEDKEAGFCATDSYKHTRKKETSDEWQRRLEERKKGKETIENMPNIRRRLEQDWQMNHYQNTGHRNFKASL